MQVRWVGEGWRTQGGDREARGGESEGGRWDERSAEWVGRRARRKRAAATRHLQNSSNVSFPSAFRSASLNSFMWYVNSFASLSSVPFLSMYQRLKLWNDSSHRHSSPESSPASPSRNCALALTAPSKALRARSCQLAHMYGGAHGGPPGRTGVAHMRRKLAMVPCSFTRS